MDMDKTGENTLIENIKGKRVLYIATKNADYIRIQQETKLIKKYAAASTIIVSQNSSYMKRVFDVYKRLLKISVKEYDVVFVGFMAQMIIPPLKWKFRHQIIIVDFFISVYDTLVDDRKKISPNGILSKVIHRIDALTLKDADYIICDTKTHGEYFEREFFLKKSKLITLYLEADSKYYYKMHLEKPNQWKTKFLVLYFGSILPVQGVDVVLHAIEILQTAKNIHFLIIGPISNRFNKVQTENVTYIEWLSQEELAKYISFSDLCLAGHFSSCVGKAKRTIPGKAYIYKAMGKDMILGDSPANRELFSEDIYNFVKMGDAEALAEIIMKKAERASHE